MYLFTNRRGNAKNTAIKIRKDNMFKYVIIELILFCSISTGIVLGQAQDLKSFASIPMDLSMMVPNIEIYINGKGPFRFDLDTGAGGSLISKEVSSQLGLTVIGEAEVGSPASEEKVKAEIVSASEMTLGELKLSGVKMLTMDFGNLVPIDGVLSLQELSDYLVTFNYQESRVHLTHGLLKSIDKNTILFGPLMKVEIEINGTKRNAHLDTGFPGSFAFPISMKDELHLTQPPVESGTAGMAGTSFRIWKAQLKGDITIANHTIESPEIILEERSGDFITIGYNTLKDYEFTIDQNNNLLRLIKIAEQKLTTEVLNTDNTEYVGIYAGSRHISSENEDLYLQRVGGMKLKLVPGEDDLYEMKLPDGMVAMNELPVIMFVRDDLNKVIGLKFIHKNGAEEFIAKEK